MGVFYCIHNRGTAVFKFCTRAPGAPRGRVGARHKTRYHTTSPVRPLHAECLRLHTLLTQKWGE
jgi:hypothetical protein